MSGPIYDGGPAFPCQPKDAQGNPMGPLECGMSLRDWFAGQALSGILSNQKIVESLMQIAENHKSPWGNAISICAYQQADAMLEARKEKQ